MCIHCDPGVDCAHDRETDTWVVPAWRNPRFQAATSTDRHRPARLERWDGKDAQPPIDVPVGPSAPVLGRDGGEPVDLLAALARSIEKAKAARRDGGER